MGGRGTKAINTNDQITMKDHLFRQNIETIHQQFAGTREQYMESAMVSDPDIVNGGDVGRSGGDSIYAYKRCACCREYSIPAFSVYYMCPICGWIDDPVQNKNPDTTDGKNKISLKEARLLWNKKNKLC